MYHSKNNSYNLPGQSESTLPPNQIEDEEDFGSEEDPNDSNFSILMQYNLLEEVSKVFNIDADQMGEDEPHETRSKIKKDLVPVGSEEHDYYILMLIFDVLILLPF